MSLRESPKRKRVDEVDGNEAASTVLTLVVPRRSITSSASESSSSQQQPSISALRSFQQRQYVAVRKGLAVRKCIFNSWKEAAEHLEGPGCNDVEYRICNNIEEAAAFAFQEEADNEQPENNNEDQGSVSHIDDFVDDIMLMIFSFVCGYRTKHDGGGNFVDMDWCLRRLLPGFGMASKMCHKRCIRYMQQVPLRCDRYSLPSSRIARMSQLGVKLGEIYLAPEHQLELAKLLYMLKSCDMENLIDFGFNLRDLDEADFPHGFAAAKWKLDAIKNGIPYKAIHDGETLELSDFIGFFKDWARTRFLRKLSMAVFFDNFHISMIQCCAHSLEELCMELGTEGDDDDEDDEDDEDNLLYDYSAVSEAIKQMPHLKKLTLQSSMRGIIRIKSKTLEELSCSLSVNLAECNCPSLKRIDISIPNMEWPVLNECLQTLEEVGIIVQRFTGNADDADKKLAELTCIIEIMPRLKKFQIYSDGAEIMKSTLYVRSPTLEKLASAYPLGSCQCPALMLLGRATEIRVERLVDHSSLTFPLLEAVDLQYDGSVTDLKRGLQQLSAALESMHMLKTLRLRNFDANGGIMHTISLRSKTIEYIQIDGLEIIEYECPMLKELNTTHLSSAMANLQQLETLQFNFSTERVDTNPILFSEVVEQMSTLKRLKLVSSGGIAFAEPIKIRSQSLESLFSSGLISVDCSCCSSMKHCVGTTYKGIPRLSMEIEWLQLSVVATNGTRAWSDGDMRALSSLIEGMPNLKYLKLVIKFEGELSIKSKSLERIDVSWSNLRLKVTECICPLLQTFLVKYGIEEGYYNGVQLAAPHEMEMENYAHDCFALADWDFVGMEAPESCVVKVFREYL